MEHFFNILKKCLYSDIFQATINNNPDKAAIGRKDKIGAKDKTAIKINIELITEEIGLVAPDFILTTVLAIAAVEGIPAKNGKIIFVIPCPTNSLFGLVLFVIPSEITAHNKDSNEPKIAIAIEGGIKLYINSFEIVMLSQGNTKCKGIEGIPFIIAPFNS